MDIHKEAYQNLLATRNVSTKAERNLIGYRLEELIKFCTFKGKLCDIAGTSFKHFYDDAYGNCYTFIGPSDQSDSKMMVSAGIDNGLHLILNLDPSDYLDWYPESVGARVTIHEPGTMPLPSSEGFAVARGTAAEFGLTAERFERLGKPYDPPCADDYENYVSLFNFKYNFKGCQKTCLQRAIIQECDCADKREPDAAKAICMENLSHSSTAQCIMDTKYRFENSPSVYCNCPQPCKENKTRVLSSTSDWPPEVLPPDVFYKMYGRKFSMENTTSVRVYFRTPLITTYKDIPFETSFQFMGWLGGQMYVWTGASLITLLEFVGFLVTACLVLCTENVDWLMDD